jgi:parallel beta-helix repeat protein
LENNEFYENSGIILSISGSKEIDVINNLFKNNLADIISSIGSDVTIKDNEFTNNIKGTAIRINSGRCNILKNKIHSNKNGIWVSSGNVIIKQNVINNSDQGIILMNSNYGTIDSNNVTNTTKGVQISNSNYNNITNNLILYSKEFGLQLMNSFNNQISHNIINQTKVAIIVQSSKKNLIYDNLFNGNTIFQIRNSEENFWNIEKENKTNIVGYNITGGNVYLTSNKTGYSQTCEDKNKDLICDKPLVLSENNIDKYPIVFDNIKKINNSTNTTKISTNIGEENNSLNMIIIIIGGLFILLIIIGIFYWYMKKKEFEKDLAIKDDKEIEEEYRKKEDPKEDVFDQPK